MIQEPSLAIRRYVESDDDEVWVLHNLALVGTGAHPGNGPWDDDLHHISEVYSGDGDFLVGTHEGQLVAMGAIKGKTANCAEVKRMRAHPDHQHRGFGQQILDELERRAVELGYAELCLATTVQQVAAQHLYLKNGFQETGRDRVGQFDVICYAKEIRTVGPQLSSAAAPGQC